MRIVVPRDAARRRALTRAAFAALGARCALPRLALPAAPARIRASAIGRVL